MSILIEQTQAEMQNSYAFSRRAECVGVRVSSAAFSTSKGFFLAIEGTLSVAIRYADQEAVIAEGSLQASTLFECLITESEESSPLAKFECLLTATYHLQEGYVPSEQELAAFHKANVIFNCWPYFREFVQSSACRMNIPPPPIPFARVQVVPNATGSVPPGQKKATKKVLKGAGSPKATHSKKLRGTS